MEDNFDALVAAIADGARKAFLSLFQNGEHYYYCTLIFTGDGFGPNLSAFSWEALERVALHYAEQGSADTIKKLKSDLQWSWADSPYCSFKEEYFVAARDLVGARRFVDDFSDDETGYEEWARELNLRLRACEAALKMLDREEIFSKNQLRNSIIIVAEYPTPSEEAAEIAARLNPYSCLLKKYINYASDT